MMKIPNKKRKYETNNENTKHIMKIQNKKGKYKNK